MKPEQVYQELRDIADKLGVGVEEHNFRNAGIRLRAVRASSTASPW
jgi:hypothetical protein